MPLAFQHLIAETRPFHQLAEQEWLQGIGDEDGGSHAYERADSDGVDGRMYREKQRKNHNHKDKCGEENRRLMGLQQIFLAGTGLRQQTFHHEDAVIHTYAEDERGDDNVDKVELQPAERHDTFHDIPAEEHRHECQKPHKQVPE